MNLRVFYLTRWGLSDGYTKQTAKDTYGARVFCRLLLEERLLKFPSRMKA